MRRSLGAAGAALVVVLAALTWRLFLHPLADQPEPVDAVVVLAGGKGERLAAGRVLAERGLGGALVISLAYARLPAEVVELCRDPQPFEVICFQPSPCRRPARRGPLDDWPPTVTGSAWRSRPPPIT